MPRQDAEITFQSPAIFEGQTGIVDHDNFVIKGVSLITGDCIAEGHDLHVDDTTVTQLHVLAKEKGKVPVNLDHGSGIKDMNGYVDNFRLDSGKLRGDWHLMKNHTESTLMLERAVMMPECFGLSVAFKGKGVAVASGKKAARAEKLLSVDCVTRPAANAGLFSAKDGGAVDMNKKVMDNVNEYPQGTPLANQPAQPTLSDVMSAIGKVSSRLDSFEQIQSQLVDAHNENIEGAAGEEMDRETLKSTLEKLNGMTDEELAAQKLSRDDVNAAIDEFNGTMAEGEGGEEGEEGEGTGAGTGVQGAAAGVGTAVPAMAGAGAGEGSTALKAIQKEVIQLRSEINAEKSKARSEKETIEFQALEGKMITLATMRDQAIELAEKLVVENETLRLHIRTGTRPVRPGVENGVRFFSANDEGQLHQFQQLVKQIRDTQKVSEGKAIELAMKDPNGPALHADWLQSQKPRTINA